MSLLQEKLLEYKEIKDLNAMQCEELSNLIYAEYEEDKNNHKLVDLLQKVKIDVDRKFAKMFFNKLTNEMNEICNIYCLSDLGKVSVNKNIFFCVEFCNHNVKEEHIINLFLATIRTSNTSSPKTKMVFRKGLNPEYAVLKLDYSNESPQDIRAIEFALKNIYEDHEMPEVVQQWILNYGSDSAQKPVDNPEEALLDSENREQTEKREDDPTNEDSIINVIDETGALVKAESEEHPSDEQNKLNTETIEPVAAALKNVTNELDKSQERIKELNEAVAEILKSVNEKRWSIFGLREELRSREEIYEDLREQYDDALRTINKLNSQIEQAETEIKTRDEIIKERDERISDLENRIRNLLNAGNSDANQKVSELKNNLKRGFSLAYADFKEFENAECTEEAFAIIRSDMSNIFVTLARLGIEFE